jgi:hypothetical protein
MKLKDLRIGEWVVNKDIEGVLFFRPERVADKAVFGFSIYIPNDIDAMTSIKEQNTVVKEGELVFAGSIEKIFIGLASQAPSVLKLSRFKPLGKEDEAYLLSKMSKSSVQDPK